MRIRLMLIVLTLLSLGFSAQAQDEPAVTFTVTIENIAGNGLYPNAGVAAIPLGADTAGPALPDSSYEFSVSAEPGDRLSFVTMMAQSTDLFFASDDVDY